MSDISTGDVDLPRGAEVLALQSAMEKLPAEMLWDGAAATRHYFADGAYAREITIPAGVVVIGKIHRHANIAIVSKGVADVIDEFGNRVRVTAPATFVSPVGSKRAVYAIEETIWTVFHPTHERDLDRIEAAVIAPDYESLETSAHADAWLLGGE